MIKENMQEMKKKVLFMCICKSCPSWIECKEKGGFCFPTISKSKCIKKENGCICGNCPVTKEMKLKHGYYCTRGSEKEQS